MQAAAVGICRGGFFVRATACRLPRSGGTGQRTNKNKGIIAMWKQAKYRQASLIVLATTVILILPNVTRLVS